MVDFQQLDIWKKSHLLTLEIYKTTKKFPKDELFGLTSQMRKSSASQATNIAEGSGRRTKADFKRFLYNTLGSNSELKYQLILSRDLEYISLIEFEDLFKKTAEIGKMTFAYSEKLID